MKHFLTAFSLFFVGLFLTQAQSKDCNRDQLRYEKLLKEKQYDAAYPIWKSQLTNCPDYVVNIYNHAESILVPLIEKSSGEQKEKYIDDLLMAYKQRPKYFPDNKNMIEGDLVSYENQYGRVDSLAALTQFEGIADTALKDRSILSFNTINSYFNTAINLYYYGKINDERYINSYDKIKNVMALSIDEWNARKAPLDDKINGNPEGKNVLDYKEQQTYTNAIDNVKFLTEYDSIYTGYFNTYLELNCYNLDRIVGEGFDANKDNEEWLVQYYYLMLDQECDSPTWAKLEDRVTELYTTTVAGTGSSTGGPSRAINGPAIAAYKDLKAGRYSSAIENFKKAIDIASSNNEKANYALGAASAYSKMGSWSNVVTWANKALSYKPGFNKANEMIAYAYYKGASQVPGNSVQQRAANWVAADYARRAGNSKLAAQYDAAAPSADECFLNGITKGSSYTVGGWIGKTTTARCVKR